jgi:hypothetical protein
MGDQFINNSDLGAGLGISNQGAINIGDNGTASLTAEAVDYDLWRMYGMITPQGIDAPYLSNPNTQCSPFAVAMLNRARKSIFKGTVRIVGNEFQQPGEVVYLEYRDLLFYVQSVSHDFSYGSGFTTSLEITYGHNVGEYIPTYLDVIGKVLYSNKDISTHANKRQGDVFNQQYVGTVIGSAYNSGNPDKDIMSGLYGEANKAALKKIIEYSSSTLSSSTNAQLELRTFYNPAAGFSPQNSYAASLASAVQQYLIGASTLQSDPSDNTNTTGGTGATTPTLSAYSSQIKLQPVNSATTTKGEYRYPSGSAFYLARKSIANMASGSTSGTEQAAIDNVIYQMVVDVWITFNNPNLKTPDPGY